MEWLGDNDMTELAGIDLDCGPRCQRRPGALGHGLLAGLGNAAPDLSHWPRPRNSGLHRLCAAPERTPNEHRSHQPPEVLIDPADQPMHPGLVRDGRLT
jgi:hypothetical protein